MNEISNNYELVSDRREHPRFKVKSKTFVATMTNYSKLGPIIDISKGGMAFYYIDQDFRSESPFNLCIVVPGDGFFLDDLPVKTVYDCEITSNFNENYIIMRRRGIHFKGLSQEHVSQIDEFIKNHTTLDIMK